MTLVREGLTNPQIAERMGITLDAAKYHVSEILSKLHLGSREEAAAWQPEPPQVAVLRPSWANAFGRWWPFIGGTAGAGVMVAAVAGLGVLAYGVMKSEGEDEASVEAAPSASTAPNSGAPSEEDVTEILNGFLEARVAGEGAYQYLDVPEENIPLLYATTSGAAYERAEFEPVSGIEWPYGWRAFKARLFAGDTVVEQLVFIGRPDGPPLGLEYQPDGFGTHIAPTTEDGQPVAVPYNFPGSEVTLRPAHPWVFHQGSSAIHLIPEDSGGRPTTDGGDRNDWDQLVLMADPAPVGTDCQTGPDPADAEALAASIRSNPDLGATAPVAVSVGGADALMMDVVIAAGASVCEGGVLIHLVDHKVGSTSYCDTNEVCTGQASGDRMRLYLFDMPEGSSIRILAIAIVAPESRFERTVEAVAPVLDSVEFHAP